jgi:SAM-dependent methyltransferase
MTSAADNWRQRVEAHHAQTHRARGDRPEGDLWSGLTGRFRGDPTREDPVLDLVGSWLTPEKTVLDVGGGAGRYAVPLAPKARHVTVVEPSPAMLSTLSEATKEAGINNVSSVAETWEAAKVEAHDIIFCANVVYGVTDIVPFLRKLDDVARETVAIVVFMEAPLAVFSPLWKAAHQEERINLPALPELLPVLWEMEIFPDVAMMPPVRIQMTPDLDTSLALARQMLWVEAGTAEDQRLMAAAKELAVETPEGVMLRQGNQRPGVVWWRKQTS